MDKRFMTIWFHHLTTDWLALRRPALKNIPFVFSTPDHGRMIITASNPLAEAEGIGVGTAVADARAIIPSLQAFDEQPERAAKLLKALGEWCIRFTPATAVDLPDGLVLDVTGCAHLWGSEQNYQQEIIRRLQTAGYQVRIATADTIGTAWAVSHFGKTSSIIESGAQSSALVSLPPASLRLEADILDRLQRLGLTKVGQLAALPRPAMRRRFGTALLQRLDQALGLEEERVQPLQPVECYQERLPCLEPIMTATGIGIALSRLLESLCTRLRTAGKGLREGLFKGYRLDGKVEEIRIGTLRPSHNPLHLFRLFELDMATIEPDTGIELFTLEAITVEDLSPLQENLWGGAGGVEDRAVAELLDRFAVKLGADRIHRYLPDPHYWPERSLRTATSLKEKTDTPWRTDRPRPIRLLPRPEPVEVTAPIPDYPPMLFRYKGILHTIKKADGPERIEREWWLDEGPHRDYYYVEDEEGQRYWIFRSGHYAEDKPPQWYLHGFFA